MRRRRLAPSRPRALMARLALLLAVLALAPAPVGQAQARRAGSLTVSILDVGQGDAILIRSPEGKTALIDAGPSKAVVDTLRRRGVRNIDLVAVSHHHTDHYGGMDDVVRAFHPRYFLASKSGHVTSSYKRLLQDVRDLDVTALFPSAQGARVLKLGSVNLIVLPQPPESEKEENDNSIGIVVSYGNFAVLLTGDSEGPERTWWLSHCPDALRDVTVLKLAHHGSRNGTNSQWLDITRPEIAVASLGTGNSFGHPHRETLELLRKHQIELLRTDQRGTISFQSDGREWDVVEGDSGGDGGGRRGADVEMASLATDEETPFDDEPQAPERGSKADRRDDFGGSGGGDRLASGGSESSRKNRVNLNTASASEIARLPGIGRQTARDIVAGRPYRTVDELTEVEGLGPSRVDRIRGQVTVR